MPEFFFLFVHPTSPMTILARSMKSDGTKNKSIVPRVITINGTNIMTGASRLSAVSPGGKSLKNAAYTIGSK